MSSKKNIKIFAHWKEFEKPMLMGILNASMLRGKQLFSFEYDEQWLKKQQFCPLDPNLGLYRGKQFPPMGKRNFGLFLDSCPDRWGRFLLQRRETFLARKERRKVQKLYESDYLLGVHDIQRIGALRFQVNEQFMDDNDEYSAPSWTSLRKLEHVSSQLEDDSNIDHPKYEQWLKMLLAPGSSLGGARPKASVLDSNEHLWIAKFPSRNDSVDIGLWEGIVNQMAKKTGILVAESKVQTFSSKHHTFLSKRFDREQHRRIHFASAMTLLEREDGDDYTSGVSYLELVEFIEQNGAQPKQDLAELWKRILFSVCISNTDDHLRNHGFLLSEKGWKLSPAYDLNPNPEGEGLRLNISEADNSLDLDLVKGVAPYFHLSNIESETILQKVLSVVQNWRSIATAYGASITQQNEMSRSFRIVE
jgi:serine/threonine-protein kinase HipA